MTKEQAARLEKLHDNKYLIIIQDAGQVDIPVYEIFTDYEEGSETEGQLLYDSEAVTNRPLEQVALCAVRVFAPVSFLHTNIEYLEGRGDDDNYDATGNFLL